MCFLMQTLRDIEIRSNKALWKERNLFDRLVVSRGGGKGTKRVKGVKRSKMPVIE